MISQPVVRVLEVDKVLYFTAIFKNQINGQTTCTYSLFFGKEIMLEVSRREKAAGIVPDPDIDAYMKVTLQIRNFAFISTK